MNEPPRHDDLDQTDAERLTEGLQIQRHIEDEIAAVRRGQRNALRVGVAAVLLLLITLGVMIAIHP